LSAAASNEVRYLAEGAVEVVGMSHGTSARKANIAVAFLAIATRAVELRALDVDATAMRTGDCCALFDSGVARELSSSVIGEEIAFETTF
jgi:hypothetical protein